MGGFLTTTWGDLASLLGLCVTAWGVWHTYQQAVRARNASEAASNSVRELRQRIGALDAVAELSGALNTLDSLRQELIDQRWARAADSAALVRRRLIVARESPSLGSKDNRVALQTAIQSMDEAERELQRRAASGHGGSEAALQAEAAVRETGDRVAELLARLRRDGGVQT